MTDKEKLRAAIVEELDGASTIALRCVLILLVRMKNR